MKVAVCISGSLREFKNCWSNISENIVQQFDCDIFLKCWKRSNEVKEWHGNLDTCTPEQALEMIGNKLKSYSFELFDKEKESTFDLYNKVYKRLHHEDTQQIRVINCLSMFYNIFECNKLQKEYSELNNKNYDCVIRIRPDLFFKYPLKKQTIDIIQDNNTVAIPFKYNYIGTNDQFAFGKSDAINKYSDCYNNIKNLYDSGCMFHPETLLKEHLRYVGVKIVNFDVDYFIKRPYE